MEVEWRLLKVEGCAGLRLAPERLSFVKILELVATTVDLWTTADSGEIDLLDEAPLQTDSGLVIMYPR